MIYTVGPTGQYKTINDALRAVGPNGSGNVVEIQAGTYVESIDSVNLNFPKGTSWNTPFTIGKRLLDGPVIIKNSGELNLRLFDNAPMYASIENLTFDGSNLMANSDQIALGSSTNGGNYVRLKNNEFVNNMRTHALIVGRFSHNNEILNNLIHDGTWTYTLSGSKYCYPIYMEGSDNLVEENEMYNFPSWGCHGYSSLDPRPSRNVYRKNLIHDWGWGDDRASGILIYHGDSNQVTNNNIWASNGREPIGIGAGASNTVNQGNVYAPPITPPQPAPTTNFIDVRTDRNVTVTGNAVSISKDKSTKIVVNGVPR